MVMCRSLDEMSSVHGGGWQLADSGYSTSVEGGAARGAPVSSEVGRVFVLLFTVSSPNYSLCS